MNCSTYLTTSGEIETLHNKTHNTTVSPPLLIESYKNNETTFFDNPLCISNRLQSGDWLEAALKSGPAQATINKSTASLHSIILVKCGREKSITYTAIDVTLPMTVEEQIFAKFRNPQRSGLSYEIVGSLSAQPAKM